VTRAGTLALALLLALSGCLTNKRVSDIGTPAPKSTPPGSGLLPPGVTVPAEEDVPVEIDGLYPAAVQNDRMCCWIAPLARVRTRKPIATSRLDVTIYVPRFSFFERHPQALTLSIGATRYGRRCCFAPGVHTLSYELPAALRARTGEVVLTFVSDYAFVPSAEHVNSDSRRLGVVLSRVDYPPDADAK
jgi:hypothetical protein